jgi:hypothetical protein
MFGSCEGRFGIDHPVVTEERSEEGAKGLFFGQKAEVSGKGELSVPKGKESIRKRWADSTY